MDIPLDSFYREQVNSFSEPELTFQAIEWLEFNEKEIQEDEPMDSEELDTKEDKSDERYIIRIFGVNKHGQSVCLNVNNFTPFFYIKVPETWGTQNVKMFLSKLKERLSSATKKENDLWVKMDYSKNLLTEKCILQSKFDFFGFNNKKKYKFLRLTFNNSDCMKKSISIIKYHNNGKKKITGFVKLPLYEANVDAFLKFAHIKNLRMSGWIKTTKFSTIEEDTRVSSCQLEFSANWNDIELLDENSNAPILQASYDIETYSIDGKFPSPEIKGNVITQIATSFKFFGQKDFYMKHIICLKKCSPIESTDNVPVFLECYNTEKEVLLAWSRLIVRTDPDILYQYNGDQFDGYYLHTRAEMNNCEENFMKIGKLLNIPGQLNKSSFSSSAYGDSSFKRLTFPGRINFDILIYIKREYKEDSYKLDYIAEKYIGQNKNPVTAQMMFKIFEEGNPDKIKEVAEYCLVDTLLPQKIVDKMHILQNQISMSNVTYVPIRFLIERGQQIKVMSQVLKETRNQQYLIPTIDNYAEAEEKKKSLDTDDSDDEESFVGATVLPPLKGAYFEPITVCDFASLYPSIIRAHNLCYSTIVLDKQYSDLPGVEYETIEWDDTIKDKVIHHNFKFAQSVEGVLPKILSELSDSRTQYKKLMGGTDDPFLKEVYNKCQLAVKVSMNSVYGFLAAPMLRCKPIAATVTAIGRKMIENTKEFMEKNYHASLTVYGDTDSVFVKFETKTSKEYRKLLENERADPKQLKAYKTQCIKESIELGKIAAKNATKNLFKFPVKLEYEKVYCPLLLLSKKRYIGELYGENPEKPDTIDKKGVVIKRRDNFPLLKTVYTHVIDTLMKKGKTGLNETKEYIEDILYKIINNEFTTLQDFIISKTLKSDYKNTNIPHLVLAKKMKERDPNSAPQSNDRVPYVFVHPDTQTKAGQQLLRQIVENRERDYINKVSLASGKKIADYDEAININRTLSKKVLKKPKALSQYEKVEDPNYVLEHRLPLDAEYYITFMKSSVSEILGLFMENPEELFDNIIKEFKESRW